MAITRAKKEQILAELEKEFKSAKSVAFTTYIGTTVAEITDLRRQLRDAGVRMLVAKKTLIKLAAKNAGLKEIPNEAMVGPVAVTFAHQDELAALQVLHKYGKDHKQVSLLGAILEGENLSQSAAMTLAQLPGKEALLGQLVGLFISPIRGFVTVGSQLISGFVRALDGVREKKEKAN
jgi:large subunit ribosomal protein L10